MERSRHRRRPSRTKARKRQAVFLVVVALLVGGAVWARILYNRHQDSLFGSASINVPAPTNVDIAAKVEPTTGGVHNLILFVGEGFGIAPMTATRIYAVGETGELAIDRLPQSALIRTTSRNAQTADAAAAMTAYMTGVKVDNEVLSQTPETRPYDENGRPQSTHGESTCPAVGNGRPLTTLFELAKFGGRATGIVSTARITQPIAAAGYAHLCQRDGENALAAQLVPGGIGSNPKLVDGIDVLFGGGWQSFLPKDDPRGSTRNDSRDLFAELRAKGYLAIQRRNELQALPPVTTASVPKVIGLFDRSSMTYELDRDRDGSNQPSLSEMTTRAIDLLKASPNGYLLLVDAGRIGEAFDAGLARKGVHEGRALDDAVAAALARVKEADPDLKKTTIVVTADHDHALVMTGNGALTDRTLDRRPGVLGVVRAYDQPAQPAQDTSGRPYTTVVFTTGDKRAKGPRSAAPPLSDLALEDRNLHYESAIEATVRPGGADVFLGAIGANAAIFNGTLDNTQVFGLLRDALGL